MAAGACDLLKGTPPANPATGDMSIFFGADGLPYTLTEAGVIVPIHPGCPTTTAGTANAQLLASTITSYALGQRFTFVAYATNTAAWTLNVNGLGVKNVMAWAGPTTPATLSYAGMVVAGGTYTVIYDGTQFILLNPAAIMGVTDGSSASAGAVGEVITASLSYASRTAMTTDTAKTIATLTLTAGAWDLSGALHYGTSGSTSQFLACISSTTNAITDTSTYGLPSATGEYRAQLDLVASAAYPQYTIPIPSYRLNLGAGATLYLVGYTSFTTGAVNAHGFLQARRAR